MLDLLFKKKVCIDKNIRIPYRTAAAAAPTVVEMDAEIKDVASNGDQKKAVSDWLGISKIKKKKIKKKTKKIPKKMRLNLRLKKILSPKPPTMVLNELINGSDIKFQSSMLEQASILIKVSALYDGKTFAGIGKSKLVAKNICCELILQHIAITSCVEQEDTAPWTALASLALFKLFKDWQAEGAVIPPQLMTGGGVSLSAFKKQISNENDIHMENAEVTVKKNTQNKPKRRKALPKNPSSRHPVELLNEMEGRLTFTSSQEGLLFRISVTINKQTFRGRGTSKKLARINAAKHALAVVYNVHLFDTAETTSAPVHLSDTAETTSAPVAASLIVPSNDR